MRVGILSAAATADQTPSTTVSTTPRDIIYTQQGTPEHMNLVTCAASASPAPAVICIHGGGWTYGSRADMDAALAFLQAQGYVGCSIDYRLAPADKFPAQIEDCKCAVRYLRAHASELNIDPRHIGVIGLSAGAHLALLLGMTPNVAKFEGTGGWAGQSSAVQCVVDMEGPTDFRGVFEGAISPQMRQLGEAVFGAPLENHRQDIIDASPMTYVKSGEPPMLIMHGDQDTLVPLSQSQELCDKLKADGDDVTLKILPGVSHGGLDHFASPENIEITKEFLARTLKAR